MKTECAAIQMSDQMVCVQCQLSWDMNYSDEEVCIAKRVGGNNSAMLKDLSLRDHFAATALSGLEADSTLQMTFEKRAEYCYMMADAMMKQRLN